MLQINGIQFEAPGFTTAAFVRAVERARAEGLHVGYTAKRGTVSVHNPAKGMTYLVTRESCTCEAGRHGRACKHRAIALHMFEVEGIDITVWPHAERTDSAYVARKGHAAAVA